MSRFFLAILLFFTQTAAYPQQAKADLRGYDLAVGLEAFARYNSSNSVSDALLTTQTLAFMAGATQVHVLLNLVCVSQTGASIGQVANMVRSHIKDNPQELSLPASQVILSATSKAYPCPPK